MPDGKEIAAHGGRIHHHRFGRPQRRHQPAGGGAMVAERRARARTHDRCRSALVDGTCASSLPLRRAVAGGRLSLRGAGLSHAAAWLCAARSEEPTSEIQSLMRTSYAVIGFKK